MPTNFTSFSGLLLQAMPYLTETQAQAIAASSTTSGGSQTWQQYFDNVMNNPNKPAYVSGAANIYYSKQFTHNSGVTEDSRGLAAAIANDSDGRYTVLEKTPLGEDIVLRGIRTSPTFTEALRATFSNLGFDYDAITIANGNRSPISSVENAFWRGASERFAASSLGNAIFIGDEVLLDSSFYQNEVTFDPYKINGTSSEALRSMSIEQINAEISGKLQAVNIDALKAGLMAVCTKNLDPDVMVMKPAKDRLRSDGTDPLNWASDRRILVQGPMCPKAVVIKSIGSEDFPQMRLAQDDQMVETLAPD